jgi:hypothetical protein
MVTKENQRFLLVYKDTKVIVSTKYLHGRCKLKN